MGNITKEYISNIADSYQQVFGIPREHAEYVARLYVKAHGSYQDSLRLTGGHSIVNIIDTEAHKEWAGAINILNQNKGKNKN